MAAADMQEPLDAKTLKLRLWWGRAVLAFSAAAAANLAAIVLSMAVDGGAAVGEFIRQKVDKPTFWLEVIFALTVTPFIETGLMAWMVDRLSRAVRSRFVVMFVSACLWSALYRLVLNSSGWLAFFPFFAFSYVYIERRREPHEDGFVTALMSHVFFNLMALSSMISAGLVR